MKGTMVRACLSMMAVALLSLGGICEAAVRCVNPAGSGGCFTSIQAAINASSRKDTVEVFAGTYVENISITKDSLLVMAVDEPCSVKILSNTGMTVTFASGSNYARLVGFLIEAGGGSGIYCNSVVSVQIRNCVVRNCIDYGIFFNNGILTAYNNIIEGNTLHGFYFSVEPQYLYNNVIRDNPGCGIWAAWIPSTGVFYENNVLWNNGTDVCVGNFYGIDNLYVDPLLEACYLPQIGSPCIDLGHEGDLNLDCDGSRNDIGIYGGPSAYCGSGPVVTSLQLVPATVVKGGTFNIQATGATR